MPTPNYMASTASKVSKEKGTGATSGGAVGGGGRPLPVVPASASTPAFRVAAPSVPQERSVPTGGSPFKVPAAGAAGRRGEEHDSNVRVFCRVRPFLPKELNAKEGASMSIEVSAGSVYIEHSKKKRSFPFDMVFSSAQGAEQRGEQRDVYAHVGPDLLSNVTQGYNACLLAYGQTGSGKTYTMFGDDSKPSEVGVIPRFCTELFAKLQDMQDEATATSSAVSFSVVARYFEIYCEKVYDLLNKGVELKFRDNGVIEGIAEKRVTNPGSVMQLISKGNQERSTASTLKNDRSSRSHALFQLIITKTEVVLESQGGEIKQRQKSVSSHVNLVDLAGSERQKDSGAEGDRFKEMVNINLSLFHLRSVIQHLVDPSRSKVKPPVRDSVLTHVLSNCFGGNSKTCMIVTVSPTTRDAPDTYNTLQYGDMARKIINHVKVNEDANSSLLRDLGEEIERLRQQLELEQSRRAQVPTPRPPSPQPPPPPPELPQKVPTRNAYTGTDDLEVVSETEELLKEQIIRSQRVLGELEQQMTGQVQGNIQLTQQLGAEQELNVSLRRMLEDLTREYRRKYEAFIKGHSDVQKVIASVKRPLRMEAGCPQCDQWRTEVHMGALKIDELEREARHLTSVLEERYVEMERMRQKQERTVGMLADAHNKLNVVEDHVMLVEDQRKTIRRLEEQVEKYLEDKVSLAMENHRLKMELDGAMRTTLQNAMTTTRQTSGTVLHHDPSPARETSMEGRRSRSREREVAVVTRAKRRSRSISKESLQEFFGFEDTKEFDAWLRTASQQTPRAALKTIAADTGKPAEPVREGAPSSSSGVATRTPPPTTRTQDDSVL